METDNITIDKGVSIPKFTGRAKSAVSLTLRKMEVGDSIVLTQRQRNAAFAIAHNLKLKLASRREGESADSVRVWRVK